jgi:hypothetical protein
MIALAFIGMILVPAIVATRAVKLDTKFTDNAD